MGWRIYLWIVGVIALMTHAPSFSDPAHPAVVEVARVAAFDRLTRRPHAPWVQDLSRLGGRPTGRFGHENAN